MWQHFWHTTATSRFEIVYVNFVSKDDIDRHCRVGYLIVIILYEVGMAVS